MGESLFWPGGGSGSGGTLAVTAPVGTTVIATNEALGKTVSKAVNAEGIAVLKGLKTGTWLLSCTDGDVTSTPVPVEIVADYTKTLAFFSATINVTYPVGSTVTCTCGTVQLVSSQIEDANGSATFVVPNAGTWTVTATANDGSSNTKSQSVEITAEGQFESVELSYALVLFDGGATVPWVGAVKSGGSYGSYTIDKTLYGKRSGNSESYTFASLYTENAIPIEAYSTLKVRFTKVINKTVRIGIAEQYAWNHEEWTAFADFSPEDFASNNVASLDISSYKGQTLRIIVGTGKIMSSTQSEFEADKVWLE